MQFDRFTLVEAEGAVLAHSLRSGATVLRKGHRLTVTDLERLREAGVATVIAARFGADDVGEDEAARTLAAAVAGEAIEAHAPFTGRANLHASARGVLVIDRVRVGWQQARGNRQ